jgi:hypothetical protein
MFSPAIQAFLRTSRIRAGTTSGPVLGWRIHPAFPVVCRTGFLAIPARAAFERVMACTTQISREASTFNFAAAPYGLFYFGSAPPLLATPFITRASGQNLGQRFPIPLPPVGTSPKNPDSNINWTQFEPISGEIDPQLNEKTPYAEHLTFSIQRQFASATLLSLSYVGTFGHHLLVNVDNNPGNPALCLGLSQPSRVMPGTSTFGPFGENGVYYPVTGGVVDSTRGPFGPLYAGNGYYFVR